MDARHRTDSTSIRAASRGDVASARPSDPPEVPAAATEELLRRAAAGDSAAWRALVAAFAPRVFGLLRAQCRDPELAEEIAQSTFCTVAAKIGDYVESGRFESWLFRIAMNRLRDEMRRRARQARSVGDGIAATAATTAPRPAAGGAAELRDRLREALARLSESDREIVDLRHVGGLSFKELSEYYDEPVGTLLARHHRALKKLRALLESMGVDAGDLDAMDGSSGPDRGRA
ncbi:MAG: polymerase sigma factor SigW [Planctomycetota bacterium]|jgi:RNA polymerase sigma-70 factor (ECF subfamily)